MVEKKCFKCGETKSVDAFYRHKAMADGHLGKCKECTKSDAAAVRNAKIEHYQSYDRQRASLPHRVKVRAEYDAAHPEVLRRAKDKWNNNPEKRRAHILLYKARRSGKINKPSICSSCDNGGKIHAHHRDYSKPLDVVWLCASCHAKLHAKIREGGRNEC